MVPPRGSPLQVPHAERTTIEQEEVDKQKEIHPPEPNMESTNEGFDVGLHPGKLTWNQTNEALVQIIFLFNGVILRFQPLGILAHLLRMVMEPKYVYTPCSSSDVR